MNTSASRQLARSCTPTQSLLKRLMAAGLSGVFSRLQMSLASAWCALPLKTTIRFMRARFYVDAVLRHSCCQRSTRVVRIPSFAFAASQPREGDIRMETATQPRGCDKRPCRFVSFRLDSAGGSSLNRGADAQFASGRGRPKTLHSWPFNWMLCTIKSLTVWQSHQVMELIKSAVLLGIANKVNS